MDYGLLGIVGLIAALIGGRYINERGLKNLSDEEKASLADGLSRYRMASLIGVVVILGVYFIAFSQVPEADKDDNSLFVIFTAVLIFYMLAGTAFVFVKMKRLGLPEGYVTTYLFSTLVQYLGLIFYFGLTRFN